MLMLTMLSILCNIYVKAGHVHATVMAYLHVSNGRTFAGGSAYMEVCKRRSHTDFPSEVLHLCAEIQQHLAAPAA